MRIAPPSPCLWTLSPILDSTVSPVFVVLFPRCAQGFLLTLHYAARSAMMKQKTHSTHFTALDALNRSTPISASCTHTASSATQEPRKDQATASLAYSSQIKPTSACLSAATSGVASQRRGSYRLTTASARACNLTRSSLTCVTSKQERPVAAARSARETRFTSCRAKLTTVRPHAKRNAHDRERRRR